MPTREVSPEEQAKLAADGLRRVSEFGATAGINVIVENHGGLSSNGKWLTGVIKTVDLPNCGTLPDFGNFEDYDRYKGVEELMPFAKGVSAKSYDFDAAGQRHRRSTIARMMKIVLDAGYHGYIGIEYEGSRLPEPKASGRRRNCWSDFSRKISRASQISLRRNLRLIRKLLSD